jgi:predicted nucleic acid-binding protein
LFGKDWKPVFDTDIFASYAEHLTKNDYRKMSFSILVLYELVARPIRQETFEIFDKWRERYKSTNRLIIPTYDDIWTSAQAIRKMRLAEQRQHKGITPAMENATAFQNDALIARSAFKKNCFVVTANVADYEKISQFMRIRFISAQDYFGL